MVSGGDLGFVGARFPQKTTPVIAGRRQDRFSDRSINRHSGGKGPAPHAGGAQVAAQSPLGHRHAVLPKAVLLGLRHSGREEHRWRKGRCRRVGWVDNYTTREETPAQERGGGPRGKPLRQHRRASPSELAPAVHAFLSRTQSSNEARLCLKGEAR